MKKKVVFLAALILLRLGASAQSKANLIIFAEDGDQFYAFINGVKQNKSPESNVKVTGLSPNVSLRIEFEDKSLPQLKQSMSLEGGFEHTARIKRDMHKQLKLRYFGQTPITGDVTPGVTTVQYHSIENDNSSGSQTVNNATMTNTITNSTTKTGNDVNINMNAGGVGMSMNVTGLDNNQSASMSSSSSSTKSSSSTSTSSGYSGNPTNTQANSSAGSPKHDCSDAMSPVNFNKMKETVESKPFSDSKMSTAKVATSNSCLSVIQIKEICKLFNMDDEKLTYAKFAYDHCIDKANYYQVSEAFSFDSTTQELNKFLGQ